MLKWLTDIGDLIGERLFGKKAPEPKQPDLNRAQRRALANQKPGERRMRLERTFIAQAKRRSSKRGDHGAKAKLAYQAGVEKAVQYFNVRIQSAYVSGLKEGRKQARRLPWQKTIA